MPKDLDRLISAINSISKIERYTSGISEDEFLESDEKADAVLIHFMNIGERLGTLSTSFKSQFPHLPYHYAKGMRNVIAHEYDAVVRLTVWDTIQNKIPSLKSQLTIIIETLNAAN